MCACFGCPKRKLTLCLRETIACLKLREKRIFSQHNLSRFLEVARRYLLITVTKLAKGKYGYFDFSRVWKTQALCDA